jgi:hypothetical protein
MKLKIFCRCSLFPSWSGKVLSSTPVGLHVKCLLFLSYFDEFRAERLVGNFHGNGLTEVTPFA